MVTFIQDELSMPKRIKSKYDHNSGKKRPIWHLVTNLNLQQQRLNPLSQPSWYPRYETQHKERERERE